MDYQIYFHQGSKIRSSTTIEDEQGKQTVSPTPQDTAIVMYTSGSTGTPKVYEYHRYILIRIVNTPPIYLNHL